jgi:hypothetical protein
MPEVGRRSERGRFLTSRFCRHFTRWIDCRGRVLRRRTNKEGDVKNGRFFIFPFDFLLHHFYVALIHRGSRSSRPSSLGTSDAGECVATLPAHSHPVTGCGMERPSSGAADAPIMSL